MTLRQRTDWKWGTADLCDSAAGEPSVTTDPAIKKASDALILAAWSDLAEELNDDR